MSHTNQTDNADPTVNEIAAIVIKTDGTWSRVAVKNELKALQQLVGGYIEHVPNARDGAIPKSHVVLCNEDGRRLALAPNQLATMLTHYSLLGDVVIVHSTIEGEFESASDEVEGIVRALAAGGAQ